MKQPARWLIYVVSVLCAPLGSACVMKDKYDAAVADGARAHQQSEERGKELASLERRMTNLIADIHTRDARIAELDTQRSNLQRSLDEATTIDEHLRAELKRLGKDVDGILAERGTLQKALADAKARLEELRAAEAAERARAKVYNDIVAKLHKALDAGSLEIVIRRGRLVLRLPNDVLFDSGKAELKPAGKATLVEVAGALASLGDRQFQVCGHSDNVPVTASRYGNNWLLSSARAVEVLSFLIDKGVPPTRLSAAGYAEFDPVASNDSPEGKRKNRRIEIVLQPDLAELGTIPAATTASPVK